MMLAILAETEPKARKPHVCGLCGGTIDQGKRYSAQRCADGGDIWTARSHLRCRRLMGEYEKWVGGCVDWEAWHYPDDFNEFLRESAAASEGGTPL